MASTKTSKTLIEVNFWNNPRLHNLSGEQKGFLLLLMTNPFFVFTGVYQIYSLALRQLYDDNAFLPDDTNSCPYLFKKYPETMAEKKRDPYAMAVYQKLEDLCVLGHLEFNPKHHVIRIKNIYQYACIGAGRHGSPISTMGQLQAAYDSLKKSFLINNKDVIDEDREPIQFFERYLEENAKYLMKEFILKAEEKNNDPYKYEVCKMISSLCPPDKAVKAINSQKVMEKKLTLVQP